MRRLYSTFAGGLPGAGLFLLRVVGSVAPIHGGIAGLRGEPSAGAIVLNALTIGTGILLLAGLWTPFAGTLLGVIEIWSAFSQPGDVGPHIVLATLGAALALLGPGAWSLDARLFGWKRINIRNRKS